MSKLYPETVVANVLDRSNIVEVINDYIPLKKAGRNFKTTCPFHAEKTASFIVSADKQIYHCFGCGAGGNAISFVMAYDRLNFREALELLAQKAGVPLPEPEKTDGQKRTDDLAKTLFALNEKTCSFYHQNLMASDEGRQARGYLAKRGISKETAQRFKLGFAPPGWDGLISSLKNAATTLGLLEKSGLVIAKEGGGYYDRFRNRIVFPIVDLKDRVVAFGARVLDDSLPKYINSPETPVYVKGKNLFGLPLAKEAIRSLDQVIVVEGYLDMIVPYEAGIKNIVASLGTALTIEQIRLIKRFTHNVVMLYDADLAGQMATLRALELLIEEGLEVRIAGLPAGEDPDSYVRRLGREAFVQMIADAKPIFDFKLSYLIAKHDITGVSGKERVVKEMLPTIKKFDNHTVRSEYIRQTAQAMNLNEQALWEDLKSVEESSQAHESDQESLAVTHYKLHEIPVTERMLVKLMLDEIHLVDKLRLVINPDDFMEKKLRKIVRFIFDFFLEGRECKPNILMNCLDDDEAINIIAELAALDIHECPNKEKLIFDCVQRLKRDKVLYQCQELHHQIVEAQAAGNNDDIEKLIGEYNALIKQRSQGYGEARC